MLPSLAVFLFLTCSKVNSDFTVFDVAKPSNIQYPKWWKTGLFYHVYPKILMSSNTDGIKDLNGITLKLDEMKEAGVTGIWLSPIYASGEIDQDYDTSDFENINPEYGTMADFQQLVDNAHARGIKIIMDFVSNYSSNQNKWSEDSENKVAEKSHLNPPNNWWNVFHWDWINKGKQYQFPEQPDLNCQNRKLKEAMKDVLKIWIDKGVDGFRVDAVPFMSEDDPLRDEFLSSCEETIIFA